MANNEEVGRVTEQRSHGYCGVVGVRAIGVRVVLGYSCQVCWRGLQEVGLQLLLAVLLTCDQAVFGDDSSVVVRSVSTRMSKVAPVGASVGHIDVEDRNSERVVILVEDPLKLRVEQLGALRKTKSTPRIEGATLEFSDRVRRGWRLLPVQSQVVGW